MSETIMIWFVSILQVLIAFGLINVWIFRFSRATKYRGAGAQNMKEEFAVYGLPVWFMYVIGFLKIVIALTMILTLFIPSLLISFGLPAVTLLAFLMLGAITMHIRVKDSFIKIIPATLMLLMSFLVIFLI